MQRNKLLILFLSCLVVTVVLIVVISKCNNETSKPSSDDINDYVLFYRSVLENMDEITACEKKKIEGNSLFRGSSKSFFNCRDSLSISFHPCRLSFDYLVVNTDSVVIFNMESPFHLFQSQKEIQLVFDVNNYYPEKYISTKQAHFIDIEEIHPNVYYVARSPMPWNY